jgi:NAD(P)-dependent dehydrogenase (short-subunit alcohol dehydrogenase family)
MDGFQKVWQVNCFAAYLLTELLEPFASDTYRVVNVSSKLHSLIGSQSVANLSPPVTDGSTYFDYALSKAGQVIHTGILNRRYSESNQKYKRNRLAFSVEPGLVKTKIMRESSDLARWLNYLLLYPILKVFASVSLSVSSFFDIISNRFAYLFF